MSYIDELRERFLSAEERFGRINEAGKEYRERLMGLMSRIEEEIRCRRDVERQQAQEIERLSVENEELRTMLMSLLQAVESGDPNSLDGTLGEMDTKVAALIGEGQGAPVAAEPAADDDDADDDHADDGEDDGEADEDIPVFSAGDMMADDAEDSLFEDDPADVPLGEDTLPENAFAGEDDPMAIAEDDAVDSADEDMTAELADAETVAEDDASETDTAAEAEDSDAVASDDSGKLSASEIADFFGADSAETGEDLPAYAHPAAGWDDFLNEDMPADEASAEASEPAADSDDPDAGSIKDLLDRVKTEVGGEIDESELDDDSNGDTAATG